MKNKICVVTGANSGIGKESALHLAREGAHVIITSRNPGKGQKTKDEIIEKSKNPNVDLLICDFASQKQIREIAAQINQSYPRIDILLNNAGAINQYRQLTEDGYELTFAVNHLGYFLLTNLLLDKLKAAPKARIINVASQAQRAGKIYFNDIHLENNFSAFKAYAQSKLANIMFTFELARRLENTGITANAVHPGGVNTGFGKNLKGFVAFLFKLLSPLFRSPRKGAETSIYLATSDDVEGISGKYFADKKEIKARPEAYDPDALKKLWQVSEELTGL